MPKENAVNETAVIGVKSMNIFEKLSAISLEITNVEKNLNVGFGSGSYKAVGEGNVLAAVRPAEAKFRVYSYPVNRKVIESGTIEQLTSKGEVKKNLFVRLEITYRFVNMDKPDEYIDIISYGDGVDSQDKTPGKAMTYADKYALLKAYKIITGDDPDQDPSEPLKGRSNTTTTPRGTAPVSNNAPKKGVSPEVAKECEELGVTLEAIAKKKGMKVEDLTDEIVKPGLVILKKRKAAPAPQPAEKPATQPQETKSEVTVPNPNE